MVWFILYAMVGSGAAAYVYEALGEERLDRISISAIAMILWPAAIGVILAKKAE